MGRKEMFMVSHVSLCLFFVRHFSVRCTIMLQTDHASACGATAFGPRRSWRICKVGPHRRLSVVNWGIERNSCFFSW